MKQFSLYDILGVLAPGAVLSVGVLGLYPDAVNVISNKDFSLGDFGVLVLISYVAGNLVAALGNILETPYWKLLGGRHTDIARRGDALVIPMRQMVAVEVKLRNLGILKPDESAAALTGAEWHGIARQIYAFLDVRKMTQRIDAFNAQYGMNRGIAAGFLALIVLTMIHSEFTFWRLQLVLLICTALAGARMHRFSRHYAAELFRQFLVSPESVPGDASTKQEETEN